MRKAKALVIPFRFYKEYPEDIIKVQSNLALNLLSELELDYEVSKNVVYSNDAYYVNEKYNPENYDYAILLIPTWIEPMLVVQAARTFLKKPILVWGFGTFNHNGSRVGMASIPGSGLVKGMLREMGVFHRYVYYLPGNNELDKEMSEKITQFSKVARTVSLLKKTRIGSVGYLFGTSSVGDIDITRMWSFFGPEILEVDTYSIIRKMEGLYKDSKEYIKIRKYIEDHLDQTIGDNIEKIVKMTYVLKELIEERHLNALTIKCHFELSQEFGQTACIPLSILGNEIVVSCESDIPVLLTQIVLNYLSGKTSTYVDIHNLSNDGILVGACGFAPSSMCIRDKIICDMLETNAKGFSASFNGYITNKNYIKEGKITIARFLKDFECKFSLHLMSGKAIGDVGEVSELGCPQYPFTEIKLDCNLDSFAQNMGSHHYAIVHDDIVEELEMFCEFKGINVIKEDSS